MCPSLRLGVDPLLLVINGAERSIVACIHTTRKAIICCSPSDVMGETYNKAILLTRFPSLGHYKKSTKYWRHETCFYYTFTGRVKSRGRRGSTEPPPPPPATNLRSMSNVVFCQQTWLPEEARASYTGQEPCSGNEFWLPYLPECNALPQIIVFTLQFYRTDCLCGLVVRVPGYRTEMYCTSCEVRSEFIYVM
jgi:hypothetical protein